MNGDQNEQERGEVPNRHSTDVFKVETVGLGQYRYNKVVEVESMRYTSGQKVFQFGGGDGF